MTEPLLQVSGLSIEYRVEGGSFRAVDDVSFTLRERETLGIVGESGSGKSTQLLALLRLLPGPARVVEGRALFKGRDLLTLDDEALRRLRGKEIGTVFQSPLSSLNPVLTVGDQIAEPIVAHAVLPPRAAAERAVALLDLVGIADPQQRARQYPHQLSGGMRQRVMIAIALACEPSLLLADEPTTALDVTVQAQILELVDSLRARLGMAVIWVTHDLGILARIADTVQVMYAGQVVERGPVRAIFKDPRNAYTLGLLQSLPGSGYQAGARLKPIVGTAPGPLEPRIGDPFAPRNPFATERCRRERPPLRPVEGGDPEHLVAAWYRIAPAEAAP